jgi:hypothetical protein
MTKEAKAIRLLQRISFDSRSTPRAESFNRSFFAVITFGLFVSYYFHKTNSEHRNRVTKTSNSLHQRHPLQISFPGA